MKPVAGEATGRSVHAGGRRWYNVAEVARMFGMAPMTLYRSIHAGQFPAVKIRGRYVIPARALEELERAAVEANGVVTSAEVMPGDGAA